MWLIDEKAINDRSADWFNPPKAPIRLDKIIAVIIQNLFIHKEIAIIGVIFCQVDKIKQFVHLNPLITLGNQKWNGAAPIFIKREIFIIEDVKLDIKEFSLIKIIKNSNLIDVKVWIRKYLIIASDMNIL
jgi:hypothetical protein